MWGELGTVAGNIFGGPAGGALGGLIGGYFDNDEKVEGVPTPDMPEQGRQYRGYLDEAFPGTTPWERLGANTPAGAISSAEMQTKMQERLQGRELQNRKDVANVNARAQVISALGHTSPAAVEAGLNWLDRLPGGDYDTETQQNRERLPYDIRKTQHEGSRAEGQSKRESIVGRSLEAGEKAIGGVASWAGDFFGRHIDPGYAKYNSSIQQAKEYIHNRSDRPRRYGK